MPRSSHPGKVNVGPSYRVNKKMPFSRKQAKAIKKLAEQSGELKSKVDSNSTSSLTSAAAFTHGLQDIIPAAGTGLDQRIGDQFTIKDIDYRISLASGTANGLIRCVIYQQLGVETGEPSLGVAGFWPSLDTGSGSSFTDEGKYKVLMDKMYTLNSVSRPNLFIRHKVKAKDLLVKAPQVNSAGTDFLKGKLQLQIYTSNATASQMVVSSNMRLRWYD